MRKEEDVELEQKTEIKILENEECLTLRPLWEEVFHEDSVAFTDYYFREKARRNRAFVLQEEEKVRAMLYLSPYPMLLRVGSGWTCRQINYIVGVATRQEYRHRGYMNRLLRTAISDMYEKKQPFAFLMPANPAIYQPYQFTYIYDRQEFVLHEDANEIVDFISEKECAKVAAFATDWLLQHYDVFMQRDEDYYKVLIKELQAQNGGICFLRNSYEGSTETEQMNGYFLCAKEAGKIEIQEAIYTDTTYSSLIVPEKKTPTIMARIIDVKEMLSMLRTTGNEVEVMLEIEDPILKENSAFWQCKWSAQEAVIQKVSDISSEQKREKTETESTSDTTIFYAPIEKLTAWVFGYQSAETCFECTAENIGDIKRLKEQLAKVKVLSRVFINEIV